MSFEITTLGEYARVQGGYAYKSKDFSESGTCPVLKIKNVRFGNIDYAEASLISEEIANETTDWKTKEGDILISMTGSGPNAPQSLVGRVARVWENEPEAWINQRVGRIVLKEEGSIHPDFLFYLLSTPRSQDYLVSNSSGSANQANISGKTIESLPCPKVDYDQSAAIAIILRELDQKILINRQINQTLEQIAQAIFKSWFVDFEPVIAKIEAKQNSQDPERAAMRAISCKTDEELDQLNPEQRQQLTTTASLFPDDLVDSELGEIPKGWEFKIANDIADVAIGKTPPRKESQWFSESPSDIKWISIRDMGESGVYALKTNEFLTEEAVDKFNVRRIPDNTVLLSFKMTVGRVAITDGEMLSNEAIAHFKLDQEAQVSTEYLYQYLKQFNYSNLGSTSSIATAVNSKTIKNLPVLMPSGEIVNSFNDLVAPFFGEIKNILHENETLIDIRDSLLPRLLSGELEVA